MPRLASTLACNGPGSSCARQSCSVAIMAGSLVPNSRQCQTPEPRKLVAACATSSTSPSPVARATAASSAARAPTTSPVR